jgi:hypothetical protein
MEGMGKDIQSLGKSLESASSPKAETPKPLEQPSGAVVTPIK